jgi:hypothetical protein
VTVLTTHNAEIRTATVEICTLTITGKQVTLATFRQLYDEDLVDIFGNFKGLPWGRVNYHPDKTCEGDGPHEHVVWQKGDELRRAVIVEPYLTGDRSERIGVGAAGVAWLDAAIVDGWRPGDGIPIKADHFLALETRVGQAVVRLDETHVAALSQPKLDERYETELRKAIEDDDVRGWFEKDAERERRRFDNAVARRDAALAELLERTPMDRDEAGTNMETVILDEQARRQRHRDRWAEILALPQLFIAT